MSLAEAESILSMTEQKGVRHAIDFEFVFIPHFLYLKQLLEKKTIGDIRSISVTWLTGGQASVSTPLRWIHDSSQGGGVLGNYASHVLHYIEWFFGSISSVSGLLRTTKQASKIDAEDTCNITALLENNNIPTSILVSNVVYGGSGHTITINGTTGTLILQNSNVFDAVKEFELYHILPDQKPKKIPIPEAYGVVDQTLHDGRLYPFVQLASKFVAQDTDVPTFKDGVRSQKLIEAIQKSDAEKKWVTV